MRLSKQESKEILRGPKRFFTGWIRFSLVQVITMIFMALLVLGTLEGTLRIMGIGDPKTSQPDFYYQQISYPLFETQTLKNGKKVFRSKDARFGFQQFDFKKNQDTFRVFVFGGSTAKGMGFSPNMQFSQFLKNQLQILYPQKNIEVINTSVIGFSTKQIKYVIANVHDHYFPDLFVVYSGNNEFLELHARMFMNQNLSPSILKVQDFLNHFQIYRGLKSGIQYLQAGGNPGEEDADERLTNFAVTESELMGGMQFSEEEFEYVQSQYHKNFKEIVQNSGKHPLLILTVASNLRWNDPDETLSDWINHYFYVNGIPLNEVEKKSPFNRRLKILDLLQKEKVRAETQSQTQELANIHFRLGKVYEELGNFRQAKEEFVQARKIDPQSRRSLDEFQNILFSLPNEFPKKEKLWILNTEECLAKVSPQGIVGFEFFYDHVHFTPWGSEQVAESISDFLVEKKILSEESLERIAYSAWLKRNSIQQELKGREIDFALANRWVGFNFNKGNIQYPHPFKYREGLQSLKNMVDLGKKNPWIYVFLGNGYFQKLNQEDHALQLYQEALSRTDSKNYQLRADILENIALVHKRNGKEKEAQSLLATSQKVRLRGQTEGKAAAGKN